MRPLFSVEEESSDGGSSYCWVTKKRGGYYMYGNEIGEMAGPCSTVCGAATSSGRQIGMDYVSIECRIEPDELQEILSDYTFIFDNFAMLSINGEEVEPIDVHTAVQVYSEQYRKRRRKRPKETIIPDADTGPTPTQ